MKLICLLCLYKSIPLSLLSQVSNNIHALQSGRMNSQTSRTYYLKNTNLSKHLIKDYLNLTKSFKRHEIFSSIKYRGYRTKDTLKAIKQIKKLSKSEQNTFYKLMQTRLQWDYEKHLRKNLLDSSRFQLRNYSDSALYFLTLGIYYKDSIYEVLARRLGFVKSDNKGNELVDWEKMNRFKFDHWVIRDLTEIPLTIGISIEDVKNSFIPYFEKAIEIEKKEFYYMIELLLQLIRLGDEEMIQEKILQYKHNYSYNEQKWLVNRMNESICRKKKAMVSIKSNN